VAQRRDLIIFVGQTLHRLSGSYYRATPHRVEATAARISIPFQLRAKSDFILDCLGLESPKLPKEKVPEGFHTKIRTDVFIDQAYGFYKDKQEMYEPPAEPSPPSIFSRRNYDEVMQEPLYSPSYNNVGQEPLYDPSND